MLNLDACVTANHHITITPTVPVRPDPSGRRGFPKITFYAPPEVDILRDSCEVTLLGGIQPVNITIKATCGGPVTAGLKRIIPVIIEKNSNFWGAGPRLPTI